MQCENVEHYTRRIAPRFLLVNTALRQKRPCKRRHSEVDANDGRAPDTKAALASGPSKIAKRWQDRSPRAAHQPEAHCHPVRCPSHRRTLLGAITGLGPRPLNRLCPLAR